MYSILAFLGGIGWQEMLFISLILLFFFGAKRIPEIARGLGKGIREFKDASSGIRNELEQGMNEEKKK